MALTDSQKSSIESKKKDIERKKNNIENVKKQKQRMQDDCKNQIKNNKEWLKNAKSPLEKSRFRDSIEGTTKFLKNQIVDYNRDIESIKRNITILKEEISRIKSR
jgi:hypothetical protein